MRSSISSSEWARTWILAVALSVSFLALWECCARWMGHRPTIVDSPGLWSYWRSQATGDRVIVVLGDSRPQLGWCNATCEKVLPGYRSILLAIDGKPSAGAVLRDLAEDEQFRGVVLVCISEMGFEREYHESQGDYVTYYHEQGRNLNARANTSVSCHLHRRIVLLDPRLKLDQFVIDTVKYKTLPWPFYVRTSQDRSIAADYSMPAFQRVKSALTCCEMPAKSCCPDQWLADAMAFERYVEAVQARGGQVAYVRFPSEGPRWEYEQASYPRATCWDRMTYHTSAICIHCSDYPDLRFHCPDGVHLDYRDKPAFTAALIRILGCRGVRFSF